MLLLICSLYQILVMTELFKTVYLNYDKSTFLIDLVKHSGSGKLYIELKQLIHEKIETTDIQVIKISSSIAGFILIT